MILGDDEEEEVVPKQRIVLRGWALKQNFVEKEKTESFSKKVNIVDQMSDTSHRTEDKVGQVNGGKENFVVILVVSGMIMRAFDGSRVEKESSSKDVLTSK